MSETPLAVGDAPIFVVGTPRSGTTLVAAMLDAHPRLAGGPESRFFARYRHLRPGARAALLSPARWPDAATDFVCDLANQGHPVHELYGLSRRDVRGWLATRPPSLAALLESLTAQRAERVGKPRWVEKTPRHLLSLDLIRRTWPHALVVRIVRDPRDVALSLSAVPFYGGSVVGNLVLADRYDRASRAFFEHDRRSMTLRYEDLVADPRGQLAAVCGFVGEAFAEAMVERRSGDGPSGDAADGPPGSVGGAAVYAEHEWWKHDATGPLDPSRAGRWRREMAEPERRFAAIHLCGFLREHGYDGAREARGTVAIVPVGDAIPSRHEGLLVGLAEADLCVRRPAPRSARALSHEGAIVFFGLGGQLMPRPAAGAARGLLDLGLLAGLLGLRRARRRPVLWVRRHTLRPRRPNDPRERVVVLLLRGLARRSEPEGALAALRRRATSATSRGRGGRARDVR